MTTTKYLQSAALTAALCVLSLSLAQAQPGDPRAAGGPKISFAKPIDPALLQRAAGLKVYKLQPPRLTRADFDGTCALLLPAVQRSQIVTAGSAIARSQGSNFILLDTRSGLLSMSKGFADQVDDRAGDLPSEARAAEIARAWLKTNKLGPADEKQFVLARVGHIRSKSFNPATGAEGPVLDQILTVNFSRLVDGTGVIGAASKMIVQVGDGGSVVGAGIDWRELGDGSVVTAKNLRTPEQIQQDIRAFLLREQALATQIDIRQAGLFYYDNGGNFLQPVIGYEAQVRTGRLNLRYFGQTPVLLTTPERVGPEAVTPKMREALRKGPENAAPPTAKGD